MFVNFATHVLPFLPFIFDMFGTIVGHFRKDFGMLAPQVFGKFAHLPASVAIPLMTYFGPGQLRQLTGDQVRHLPKQALFSHGASFGTPGHQPCQPQAQTYNNPAAQLATTQSCTHIAAQPHSRPTAKPSSHLVTQPPSHQATQPGGPTTNKPRIHTAIEPPPCNPATL